MADMEVAPVQQPDITPVAEPNRLRFTTPAASVDHSYEDLARGLSQLDAGLGSFMQERQAKQDAADKAQGDADFYKNNQEGYAQGVASGTIPASQSPAYVAAYKGAQGSLAGDTLQQQFQAAYDNWPGKGQVGGDPDAYSKFTQDFFARNIGTTDPAVLAGLMPKVHAIAQEGLRQHIVDQHNAVVTGYSDTQSALVANTIGAAVGYANSSGNPVDPGWVATQVGAAYDDAVSKGVPTEQAQKNAIEQITAAAELNKAHHGDEILKALDQPMGSTGIVLSQTPYGTAKKVAATDTLDTFARTQVLQASEAQKAADKVAAAQATTNILTFMAQNPGQDVPEGMITSNEYLIPDLREKVASWHDTLAKAGGTSDPQAIMNLQGTSWTGVAWTWCATPWIRGSSSRPATWTKPTRPLTPTPRRTPSWPR